MKPILLRLFFPPIALLCFVSSTAGQTTIWTDGAGDWFNANNWSAGVPDANTDAEINNGGTAQISGSDAEALQLILGNHAANSGTLAVSGRRTLSLANMMVGMSGTGTLNITNGATVTFGFFGLSEIGVNSGSHGMVTVDGADSTWAVPELHVGGSGTGNLSITNGGSVDAGTFASIGHQQGSNGTVAVDGLHSNFFVSNELAVGEGGTGNLDITNGGTVVSGRIAIIGDGPSAHGTVTVDGAGSTLGILERLSVGDQGIGTLTIVNGGTVLVSGVNPIILFNGASIDGLHGILTVDGAGSTFTVSRGGLNIGFGGSGTLNISNGGAVTADGVMIAAGAGSTGTLNIGATAGQPARAPGTLNGDSVIFGDGDGTINFNHTATDYVFAPSIRGNGVVNVLSGTTILTAASTYTGDTTINGGVLQVDGSITSNTFINPGGTLAGNGHILANVTNMGTVAPGNSPGTLTIGGNYTQRSTGTLQIEIAGLAFGQHDLLSIGGSAALDGTLQLRLGGFHAVGTNQMTILTATGGVNGEFSSVISDNSMFRPEIIYEANDILLQLVQLSFIIDGLSPNQESIAHNLDKALGNARATELIDFLEAEPAANLPRDYDLIAPEDLTSIYEIGFSEAATQSFNLQRRMDDIRAGSTGFSAAGYQMHYLSRVPKGADGNAVADQKESPAFVSAPDNRWGVFVTGTGEFVNVGNEDFNARGYDITTGAVTLGADYRITNNFGIGLSGAYARSDADLVNRGHVGVDGGGGGMYATFFTGGLYFDGAIGGSFYNYNTRRAALLGDARASTEGNQWNALLGSGYDWRFGPLTIGPIATLQYASVNIDSFTESGSLAPLHFPDQNEDSIRSTIGLRAAYDWRTASGVVIRPAIRASWEHQYGDTAYPIESQLASGAGDLFTVHGSSIGRESAVVSAGVAVQWNDRFSTYIYYDGQLARENYDSHSVNGGLGISF